MGINLIPPNTFCRNCDFTLGEHQLEWLDIYPWNLPDGSRPCDWFSTRIWTEEEIKENKEKAKLLVEIFGKGD